MGNPNTPSKRSMEIASKIYEKWKSDWTMNPKEDMRENSIWLEGYYPDPKELIALAFDRLRDETIEECAKVADNWIRHEQTHNDLARAIRLKLKGGEE